MEEIAEDIIEVEGDKTDQISIIGKLGGHNKALDNQTNGNNRTKR